MPAVAGEARTGTLVCDDGASYAVEGQLYGNGWKLQDGTRQFVVTSLVVSDGRVLVKPSTGKQRLDRLHCSYSVSDQPGLSADVEGFLTPRS